MVMGEERRYYDREFKYEAIRLVNEGKRSIGDIVRDLDIHPNLLHQWRRKYRADMEGTCFFRQKSFEATRGRDSPFTA